MEEVKKARVDLHIRLPSDLHAALVDTAEELGISLNAVMVIWLQNQRKAQ